jgi:uncharacterized membrane protein YfcA
MGELLILLGAGIFAGILGGLLGLGGGIILMPLLRFGFHLSPFLAAGTCIIAVFFTTLGGSYRHIRMGHVQLATIVPVLVAGALSAVLALLAFQYLTARGRWIDLGMGLVFTLMFVVKHFETEPSLTNRHFPSVQPV